MDMKITSRQQEVDANYEAFKAILPKLIQTDRNKFALMHKQEVIACFDTSRDAIAAGNKLIDGHFSVQQITDRSIDLGYFSHVDIRRAV